MRVKYQQLFQILVLNNDYYIRIVNMDKKQELLLKLPNTNACLLNKFPNDPNGDIKILYKKKQYRLQKLILKANSSYLNKVLDVNSENFEIKSNFNEVALDHILSLFYGNSMAIDRNQIQIYFQIAKFLEIQHLIKLLLRDIHQSLEQYDTFLILKMAFDNKLKQIQKLCLQQLQRQQFEQLKYYQLSLLSMDKSLFKKIIKLHNAYKKINKRGVKSSIIEQIIKLYCEAHNIHGYQADEIKLELIDINSLTSYEYKIYFLEPLFKKVEKFSSINTNQDLQQQQTKFKRDIKNFFQVLKKIQNKQCTISEQIYGTLQIKYYVESIYLKKKVHELEKQNIKILQELNSLKSLNNGSQSKNAKNSFDEGGKQIKNGRGTPRNEQKIQQISKYITVIDKMNEEFEEKLQVMNKIVQDYEKSQKNKQSSILQSVTLETKHLNAHQVHKMMINDKTQKPPIPLSQKNSMLKDKKRTCISLDYGLKMQKQCLNRIHFDIKPICLRPQFMRFLTEIVTSGFKKKMFSLIYRRSLKHAPVGENSSIYNRKESLLVLIKNSKQEYIGGYLTSTLQQLQKQIPDKNALIFNLNKKILCKIEESQVNRAIQMSESNLLSFSSNLQIPSQCLAQKGRSNWPGGYRSSKQKRVKNYMELPLNQSLSSQNMDMVGRNQLEIQQQFEIQTIEIYEGHDNEMEMLL